MGQWASIQCHTQPRLLLNDPRVNAGLTWQTRKNWQILLLLQIKPHFSSPVKSLQGYAACQICIRKPVCVCVCMNVRACPAGREPTWPNCSFSALVQCCRQLCHKHAAMDHHEAFLFRSHSVLQRPTEGISVNCNEYLWLDGAHFWAPCVKRLQCVAAAQALCVSSRRTSAAWLLWGAATLFFFFYLPFNNTSRTQSFNYLLVIWVPSLSENDGGE